MGYRCPTCKKDFKENKGELIKHFKKNTACRGGAFYTLAERMQKEHEIVEKRRIKKQ